MTPFQIVPLGEEVAEKVRHLRRDDHGNSELEPIVADAKPGYPCRVCLEDAKVGESLFLFSYSPFNRPRPYRSVGPIFVHAHRCRPYSETEELPAQLRYRLLALRAYDEEDRMLGADVVDGRELEVAISQLFQNHRAQYIHVHNARAGCFACRIERR